MMDVHEPAMRSYNMSRIKGKHTKPELIVPSFLNLKSLYDKKGISFGSNAEMIENEDIKREITKAISDLNVNINHVEQVKEFKLLPQEWSLESGELTPTMKLKRRVIQEAFASEIESLYA